MSEPQPIILFPHIAKTAGSTATAILHRAFQGRVFGAHDMNRVSGTGMMDLDYLAAAFRALPAAERQGMRFIHSHMAFGLHEKIPHECKYITFVRDPVARVVSSYNYMVQLGFIGPETSFEAFVDIGFLGASDNMVRTLNGDPSLDTHDQPALQECARPVTEADYARAIRNIDDHFVACIPVEFFDRGMIDFFTRRSLRPSALLYTRQNVTETKQVRPATLSEETLAKVRERNIFDQRLYRHACARFEERCRPNRQRYDSIESRLAKLRELYRSRDGAVARWGIRVLANLIVSLPPPR